MPGTEQMRMGSLLADISAEKSVVPFQRMKPSEMERAPAPGMVAERAESASHPSLLPLPRVGVNSTVNSAAGEKEAETESPSLSL